MQLKYFRTLNKYTLQELAFLININYRVYLRYELEQRSCPIEVLIALADLYGITLDELVGRSLPKKD